MDSKAIVELQDYFRELEGMSPSQAWQHESCLKLYSYSEAKV